jgi:hypothetical protein
MSAPKITWTEDAIRALGVRTTVPIAGEIIMGWHRDDSYDAAKRGEFPVPVIRPPGSRRMVVPVAPILELLRIRPPDTGPAGSVPPEPAQSPTTATPLPRSMTSDDDTPGRAPAKAGRRRGAA